MNKEIVIAAYDKDLSWLSTIDDNIKKTIYRKGNYKLNDGEIKLANVGRDVHTFFNHLYLNYDNLSDITFFVQDYPFDHWEDLIDVINNDTWVEQCAINIGGYYGFHFNTNQPNTPINLKMSDGSPTQITVGMMWGLSPSQQFDSGNVLVCNRDGTPQDTRFLNSMNLDDSWNMFFNGTPPTYYEFVPGGHFGVTQEQVHLRDKEFYKKIIDILETDINSPWVIERLECYLFNPQFIEYDNN